MSMVWHEEASGTNPEPFHGGATLGFGYWKLSGSIDDAVPWDVWPIQEDDNAATSFVGVGAEIGYFGIPIWWVNFSCGKYINDTVQPWEFGTGGANLAAFGGGGYVLLTDVKKFFTPLQIQVG